ncbi:MAG: FAD/NAD(P)-binding protein [Candidatus Omnitrophica bacterium]|nr:FAD/NAD(P)-binding protein [Candidatus Omnitrophota bacterium]
MSISTENPMLTTPFRIKGVRKETHDTFTLELESQNGKFSFEPGQFNMLYVYGIGEVPISISSDPTKPDGRLTHTAREVGVVTKAMKQMRTGDTLGVRGPFGTRWPLEEAVGRDVVIVTGGIGLAPLRPALYQLIAKRNQYRKVVLLYGARTPDEILYQKELQKWGGEFDLEVHVTVDRATGAWRGNVGVVTTLISRALFDPSNAIAMVCGPEIMMRYTIQELGKRGISNERIYVSMERNMKCAIGFCGHCQFGPMFVCQDGPVFQFNQIAPFFGKQEV